MIIERTDKEIIIKLSADLDIEELQQFFNFLRYKELSAKSKATQEDADSLANEANQSWWDKNKGQLLPKE